MPRDARTELADLLAVWHDDPLAFVRGVFRWGEGELAGETGPDTWQAEELASIAADMRGAETAVRHAIASGHGVGKTALVSWLILWFVVTRPQPHIVVTANTEGQLNSTTWRELALWHKRMEPFVAVCFEWTATRFYHVDHQATWFASAIPWTKEKSEAFAGKHAPDVLIVFDEASAIDREIWTVAEGALTTKGVLWCAFGNPTRATGGFAECFGKMRHRWRTRHVDSRTAKKANQAQLAQWVEDYGEDSDFVRVRVRGLFPSQSSEQFIGRDIVMDARKRAPDGQDGLPLVLGIDVARFGDDQTVFLARRGRKVEHIERHRGLDTMQTAARVADLMALRKPDRVFVDGVGVGGGVVDRLRQLGHDVVDVNAGGKAVDDRKHMNLRAEMWSKMRDWIKAGGCLPERDEELATDLTAPEYHFDARNRLAIEKKEDMKRRGLASPDAADALAMTFALPVNDAGARKIAMPGGGGANGWMGA